MCLLHRFLVCLSVCRQQRSKPSYGETRLETVTLGRLQVGLFRSPAHPASPEKPLRAWPEGSKEKAPVAGLCVLSSHSQNGQSSERSLGCRFQSSPNQEFPQAEPFSRAWEPPTGIYLDEAGPSVPPDLLHIATWGRQAALIKHHQAPLGSQSSLKTVI